MIAGREIRNGCAERHHVLLVAMRLERTGELGGPLPAAHRWDDSTWRALVRAAGWHRVRPSLQTLCAAVPGAPAWVTDVLAEAAAHDAAQRLIIARTCRLMLSTLDREAVAPMLLKGAALVETVYPAGVPRDMGDIDVLVREGEIETAVSALSESGFCAEADVHMAADHHHAPPMMDPAGLVSVELHARLLSNRDGTDYPTAPVFGRSRPSATGVHRLPSAEDLLIHVCLHFLDGRRVRSEGALGQVRDIAWIVERGGVDWDRLESVAAEIGVSEHIALVLRTAQLCQQMPTWPLSQAHDASRAAAELFVPARVLVDWSRPPLGTWVADRSGPATALRWSGGSLGDLSRRSIRGAQDRRPSALARRRTRTALRLSRSLIREPVTIARDISIERQLRALA